MSKPTAYSNFVASLNEAKTLIAELKALKKDVQKKRRRLKTLTEKYAFIEDIVEVGKTGTPLSLSIKTALKQIGFNKVLHLEKEGREDLKVDYEGNLLLIEVTGVKGEIEGKKVRQIMANTLVARKKYSGQNVHGCLMVNHWNETHYTARKITPFKDKKVLEELQAAGLSLVTTLTLREMLMAAIRKELNLDEFFAQLCIFGEVRYSPE